MSLDDDLLKAMRDEAAFILSEGLPILRAYFADLFREKFYASVTVQDLLGGDLREELGLGTLSHYGGGVEPSEVLADICEAAIQEVQISYVPDSDLGTLSLEFLDKSYASILGVPGATYISQSKKGSTPIPWVSWLLLEGTNHVTETAMVYSRSQRLQGSRTGETIMVNPIYRKMPVYIGTGYAISPPHAGTAEDNFLTRIAEEVLPELQGWFQQELFNAAAYGGQF